MNRLLLCLRIPKGRVRFPSIAILMFLGIYCLRSAATAMDRVDSMALLVEAIRKSDDPDVRRALLRGMLRGLEGRRHVTPPAGWDVLSAELAGSEDAGERELSAQLSQIFGDRAAMQRALDVLKNSSADSASRRRALRSLLNQQNQEASLMLETLLDEPALQLDAIRGYAAIENATAPAVLLERYRRMAPESRRAVVETLAARKDYAEALLTAVEAGRINRDEIPSHVARSLHSLLGDRFTRVFGEVKSVADDREKIIEKYKQLLTPARIASADAARGRAVFKKTCASCHVLYDDGARIGPDLTGSNRANLDYILLNSVAPSYDVPAGYRMVTIITVAGRVLNGLIAEEDETRVVLKTVEEPRVVILKEDIDVRKASDKSMMPEGQLDKMKPQEVADLIRYLRTTEQVELPQ